MSQELQRRMGDAIAIPGDYQHRALTDRFGSTVFRRPAELS